jgi:hypothetical protein
MLDQMDLSKKEHNDNWWCYTNLHFEASILFGVILIQEENADKDKQMKQL